CVRADPATAPEDDLPSRRVSLVDDRCVWIVESVVGVVDVHAGAEQYAVLDNDPGVLGIRVGEKHGAWTNHDAFADLDLRACDAVGARTKLSAVWESSKFPSAQSALRAGK